ncbi:MAG: hypothetical protein F2667_10900 [Actinobacteria bacterium]|uniref:Unannotated protein n=1 Tax=freshwater metagenome TaxID=449393 RepID=A0A6J6RHE2_9ZZZZ|nr:hypothetical protein [Actinomycetota bacterium]
MNGLLTVVVLAVTLVAAIATVVLIVRDQSPPGDRYFALLGVLLLVLLVQAVGGCVALASTERQVEGVTFVAYLFTALLVVPVGAALALGERTRWGTGALLVALLTVAACEARLDSLWSVAGA